MSIKNDTMIKGEQIYFSCLFGLLATLLSSSFCIYNNNNL